jgi:glycosyltransferase involved in cell wall biosynthesis
MKRKKLHAVVKYFYPVAAGIETNMLETYFVLVRNGWDVTIHTSKDTYTKKNSLPDEEIIRGIKVRRYRFKTWGFVPEIDWRNAKLICFHNFDVFPHSYLIFYLYIRKLVGDNFSVVLTPHGGFSLDASYKLFPVVQRVMKKLYHKTFAPLLINKSVDAVRAVSKWEKQEMIRDGIDKKLIRVISNGIEDEAYYNIEKRASDEIREKVKGWGKYIIQVGRVYPIKNYETTIRALKDSPNSLKFVIVGPIEKNKNPDYWKNLQELIFKLNMNERVIFAGVIRGIDKFYAMKHAQMMVHMALWESFCNVVHEGMSQGLPVIVANNTALPFLVKEGVNGYLIDTYDAYGVSERINYLLTNMDTKKVKRMKSANIKFGREHAWSKVAKKMDDLYTSLI